MDIFGRLGSLAGVYRATRSSTISEASLPPPTGPTSQPRRLQVSRLVHESKDSDDGDGSAGSSSTELHRLKLAAPVLSMDFCPASAPIFGGGGGGTRGLILAGGMDGGSHLISIDERSGSGSRSADAAGEEEEGGDGDDGDDGAVEEGKKNGVALLASMKNHAKYVVVCRCVPSPEFRAGGVRPWPAPCPSPLYTAFRRVVLRQ